MVSSTRTPSSGFRLSTGSALIPPAIAFVFDREGRSNKEIEDAERLGGVHFLHRRAFENYLLNPDAIAYSLNRHPPFSTNEAPKATTAAFSDWLSKHQLLPKYGTDGKRLDLVSDRRAEAASRPLLGPLGDEVGVSKDHALRRIDRVDPGEQI
jgi:hypothetical protein